MSFTKYLSYIKEKLIKTYPLKKKSSSDLVDLYFLINLYETKPSQTITEISSEVDINDPIDTDLKSKDEIIKSTNFIKRYTVFLKIIFSALLINVEIFKIYRDNQVFMNLYDMKNSFLKRKKKILQEITIQIDDNTKLLKNLLEITYLDYQKIFSITITQIKVIDKVVSIINKIIERKLITETESIMNLVMPYFYKYQDFIETYTMI
jgi:hypothetical protein